jgi:hypothetical protein
MHGEEVGWSTTRGGEGAVAPTSTIKITATLSELSVVLAAPLDPALALRRTAAAATAAGSRDEDGDEFFDASEEIEWWVAGGGTVVDRDGSERRLSLSPSSPLSSSPLGPQLPTEQVLARIVLSCVSATVVTCQTETEVSVGLAALTVHDSYATAVLGRPCHLLTSGAAALPIGSSAAGVFLITYRAVAHDSLRYAGVDAEVAAVLGPLSLAVRRPTIAALAALPAAIEAARGGVEAGSDSGGGRRGTASTGTVGAPGPAVFTADDGVTALETGKRRVAMSVTARVDALRLVLLLDHAEDDGMTPDDSGCLAEAKVTCLDAALKLYPSTIRVNASMGSLQVVDPRLPADHPYRFIVQPATRASDEMSDSHVALVTASYETFDAGTEDDGATAAAGAKLASLRVVCLHRLVAECQSFFNGLAEAVARPSSVTSTPSASSSAVSTSRSSLSSNSRLQSLIHKVPKP